MIQQAFEINNLGTACGLVKCFLSVKSPKIMKSGWGDWKRLSCHWTKFFIAVGVMPVELLACQISMVSVAN